MVDVTASLDAATQQILALLAQLRLSNVRYVTAQDIGAADAYLFAPQPGVTSYGADLVLVADIANPNATTMPKLTIQGLGTIPIQAADGSATAIGSVSGKRLIGFSTIAGGGFAARLLGLAPADVLSLLTFYGADTSGAPNTVTVAIPGFPQAGPPVGRPFAVKVANTNTAATSITVNAGLALPIKLQGGAVLAGGELVVGDVVPMVFDGASVQIYRSPASKTGIVSIVGPSSGNVVVPLGCTVAEVEGWSGGGGGGGSGSSGGTPYGGGGGGGGGYSKKLITGLTPGAMISYVIGGPGTGGAINGGSGTSGGSTSFGSYLSITGGGGAGGGSQAAGGTGGSGSGGDLNLIGVGGGPSIGTVTAGGAGGAAPFGGGGSGGGSGVTGGTPGGGGGGCGSATVGAAPPGAPGVLRITWR